MSTAWDWCRMAAGWSSVQCCFCCTVVRAAITSASREMWPLSATQPSSCSSTIEDPVAVGPCDPESQTLEENIHDVDALRDYLGLERVSILGSSYGGVVAQGYAINYPDHVFKLILSCTAPSFGFMDDAKRIVAERGSAEHERVCKRLWDGTFESEEQLHEYYRIMGPMYSTTFDLDKFEATWSQSIRNFDQLNRGFGDFLRSFDYTDQLHMIRCPTLVLAGAHDWICPPDQSQLIAEKIPRAQLKIFANSAHSIAADETDAYVDTVRGFLAREGA